MYNKIFLHALYDEKTFNQLLTVMNIARCAHKIIGGYINFLSDVNGEPFILLTETVSPMFLVNEEPDSETF